MENTENKDVAMLLELTADVVSSYVSHNPLASHDLPGLIRDVFNSMDGLASKSDEPAQQKQKPAVSIKKSLNRDYLICLEDGKKFKSLKRHLKTHYDLSPEEYREKWGLPADYPMVAPAYAEQRSKLAKQMGLGQKRKSS